MGLFAGYGYLLGWMEFGACVILCISGIPTMQNTFIRLLRSTEYGWREVDQDKSPIN